MGQFIQRVLDLFDTTPPLASASNLANPNKTQSLANPGRPGELLSQALPLAQVCPSTRESAHRFSHMRCGLCLSPCQAAHHWHGHWP